MFDTGSLFEMKTVNKLINEEQVVKEIRKKSVEYLFSSTFLSNSGLFKKFRAHLSGMGL